MRFHLPSQPRLKLVDLLRRRRMTLQDWLKENVVNTYDDLLAWCRSVGVAPPTEDEWTVLKPVPVVVAVPDSKPVRPRRKDGSGLSNAVADPDPNQNLNSSSIKQLVTGSL